MSEILWLGILGEGVLTSYFQIPVLIVSMILFSLYLLFTATSHFSIEIFPGFIVVIVTSSIAYHLQKATQQPFVMHHIKGTWQNYLTQWHEHKQHHSLFLHL